MNANDIITTAKAGLAEGGREVAIEKVVQRALEAARWLPESDARVRVAEIVDAMLSFELERAERLAESGAIALSAYIGEDEDEDEGDEGPEGIDLTLEERVARLERVARGRGLL